MLRPWGIPSRKNETHSQLKNNPLPSIEKWSPLPGNDSKNKTQKNQKLSLILVFSIVKQHYKKMTKTPQKCDFLTLSIQNIVRKVEQFVRKSYITWLIDLVNKIYDVDCFLVITKFG